MLRLGPVLALLGALLVPCCAQPDVRLAPARPAVMASSALARSEHLRVAHTPAASSALPSAAVLPLFRKYPKLGQTLPRLALGRWPTPVERLDVLGKTLGIAQLYVKRDDLGGTPYGGNKVRKLELVLGDAKARGKDAVITFGGVGSNHTLATALYARQAGLRAILWLLPEPPSAHVRHNLLAELELGAELHLTSNDRIDALVRASERGESRPGAPYVIAPGGSSVLGNLALVNAAFELAEQVASGQLPVPAVVYLATGTLGSAVGLAVGLKASGLDTRVVAVRASSTKYVNAERMATMVEATVELLRQRDPSFPEIRLAPADLVIEHGYVGRGYALPTPKGLRAIELVRQQAALELDPTYTAKAFAALIDAAPKLGSQVVLYWHTYDPRPLAVSAARPEDLPRELRGYAAAKPLGPRKAAVARPGGGRAVDSP